MSKLLAKLIFIKILFLGFLCNSAFSQDHAGRVVKIIGQAKHIGIDGQEKSLHLGDYLHEGDQVETANASMIKILMNDDTLFHVGPNSHFVLEQFQMVTKSERRAVYQILKGKMRSLFTIKAKEGDLKIKTPNVAMGVRGTEIVSDVYMLDEKLQTDIALVSGKLEIEAEGAEGSVNKSIIEAGEMLRAQVAEGKSQKVDEKIKLDDRTLNLLKAGERRGQLFLHDALKESGKAPAASFDFQSERLVFIRKGPENRAPASIDEISNEGVDLRDIGKDKSVHENIVDAMREAVERVGENNSDIKADEDSEREALKIARTKFNDVKDHIIRDTAAQASDKVVSSIVSEIRSKKYSNDYEGKSDIARVARGRGKEQAREIAATYLNRKGQNEISDLVKNEIYSQTKLKVSKNTEEQALAAAIKAAKNASKHSDLLMNDEIMELAKEFARAQAQKTATKVAQKAAKDAAEKAVSKAMKEVSGEILERATRLAAEKAAGDAVRRSQQEIRKNILKNNLQERTRLPANIIQKKVASEQIKDATRLKTEEQLRLQETQYKIIPPPLPSTSNCTTCE